MPEGIILNARRNGGLPLSYRGTREIIEMGRRLAALRERNKGGFETACLAMGLNPRVARRYIKAGHYAHTTLLPSREHFLDRITPTVLYRLADGKVSVQVVEEAIRQTKPWRKVMPKRLRAAKPFLKLVTK